MPNITIQIVSDTVCPWCFVGFKRLTRAITTHKRTHPSDTFTLHWKAFYLNPSSPPYPGQDKVEMYNAKFGAERVSSMFARLASIGSSEGIEFSFGGRTGRTRDSHRVIWLAGELEKATASSSSATATGSASGGSEVVGGLQTRVVENLFAAYFENQQNITDKTVLRAAAVEAGIDGAEVDAVLDSGSDRGGEEVDEEAGLAARKLVSGVPFFEIGRYVVEGADEPETFLEIFEKVREE